MRRGRSSALLVALPGWCTVAGAAPLIGHGSNSILYDVDATTGATSNPRDVGTTALIGVSMSPGGVLYGVGFNDRVYTIDPVAGTSSLVGTLGFSIGEGDLAFDPTTGVLYGMAFVDAGNFRHLFTIDTATGAGTDVGVVLPVNLDPSGMAIDEDGTLFVLDTFNDDLLRVDKSTGDVLSSLALSGNLGSTAGMDFDPVTGELYVADGGGAGTNSLYTLDPANGQLDLIGPTDLFQGMSGLVFIPEPTELFLLLGAGVPLVRSTRR